LVPEYGVVIQELVDNRVIFFFNHSLVQGHQIL
jgi:hypothetical protein